jgi:hypothetical protein
MSKMLDKAVKTLKGQSSLRCSTVIEEEKNSISCLRFIFKLATFWVVLFSNYQKRSSFLLSKFRQHFNNLNLAAGVRKCSSLLLIIV